MKCECTGPGYCPLLKKTQGAHHFNICQHQALTPEKCEVIQANWLRLAGLQIDPDYCPHRSEEPVRNQTCGGCGDRSNVDVYKCGVFGECSLTPHQGGPEHSCRKCEMKPGPLAPRWDLKIDGLYPEKRNQNFNCSLLVFKGKRLLAYRHRWTGSRVGLCELDDQWHPRWNCLVKISGHRAGSTQEDPRLFEFRGRLHVAYTTFHHTLANGVSMGYARLQEKAPGVWEADEVYLPNYPQRQSWEKNWSFFESGNRLWCINDSKNHTILEIQGNQAEFAYSYSLTIPGSHGFIRGGPSPVLIGDRMYAFPHFKQLPKLYTMGMYTFNPVEPFEPLERCPYKILRADPQQNTSIQQNANVAFPCGAAVIGDELVVSYGAYDRDCRLAGYDLRELKAAAVPYSQPHPTSAARVAPGRVGHQPAVESKAPEATLPMYWWKDKPNFGDVIGPAIVSHYSGRRHAFSAKAPRLLTCGSIIVRAKPGDVVWGSGVHDLRMKLDWSPLGITFLAVRGPITREFIQSRGGDCPAIYGDPALLLPELFPIIPTPHRPLAAMPHLGDKAGRQFAKERGIPLIDPGWPWQQVVAEIGDTGHLVTSSLHGLIAAEAYGVPVTWAAYTESPEKFNDYYQGVGRTPQKPLPWDQAIEQQPPAIQQAAPAELLQALVNHFRK